MELFSEIPPGHYFEATIAWGNGSSGFYTPGSSGNTLDKNQATDNRLSGFVLYGANQNVLTYNAARQNGLDRGGTAVSTSWEGRQGTSFEATTARRTAAMAHTAEESNGEPRSR